MLIYPEYLRIPVGPAEMSAPRLVALVLLIRILVVRGFPGGKLNAVDALVVALWAWTVVAQILAGAGFSSITAMIGKGLDTVVMYVLARVSLSTMEDVKSTAIPLVITATALCILGTVESLTSYSIYAGLENYRAWTWFEKPPEYRLGLLRAKASTSHYIYYGTAMVVLGGFLWGLSKLRTVGKWAVVGFVASLVGSAASLSSGPMIAAGVLCFLITFERLTWLIKPTLILLLAASLFIEIFSNRHFYNLIDYLALQGNTAWYRTRLIEVAISRVHEYWLVGIGNESINHWGKLIDGRKHVDVVNNYIIIAIQSGLLGLFLFVAAHALAIRKAIVAFKDSSEATHGRMIFGWSACILAVDAASMSVGLFGPPLLISYLLLGSLVSACDLQTEQDITYWIHSTEAIGDAVSIASD